MRAILVGILLLLVGGSASACPVDGPCVRAPVLESRHAVFGAAREIALTTTTVRRRAPADEVPMPWIWQVLKDKVVGQLPRYEQRSFAMHLSPVVVSTVDTVPGVGVEGRF